LAHQVEKMRQTKSSALSAIALLMFLGASPASAQVVAPPGETWGKVADNHIHAQAVVNAVFAANPDLVAIGLHSVPPGVAAKPGEVGQVIVAQTEDRIGAKDAPGDLEETRLDQMRIALTPLGKIMRMKVAAPLRDGAGRIIGLAVISFKPAADMNKMKAHVRADAILAEFARNFPDQASLFTPVR
jgi:hypothetical protein